MRRWNADHQPAVVNHDEPAVMPGESYDFTQEQLDAGLAGVWSEEKLIRSTETKKELLARAQEAGLDIPAQATKTEIEDLLEHCEQSVAVVDSDVLESGVGVDHGHGAHESA